MSGIEAQELLVPNPLLYSDLKKYVWISDSHEMHKHAQVLFDYLLKKNIYITGFVTDKKTLFGLKMFHKPIFNIDDLDEENTAVFFDPYFTHLDISASVDTYSARIINPKLDHTNVVIWGSGFTGRRAYAALTNSGIDVKYFVDSDRTLDGGEKFGLPIYAPDRLVESENDITIVEALAQWKEVDESIKGKYRNRFHYCLRDIDGFEFEENRLFSLNNYCHFSFFQSSRVYIYGLGTNEKEMAQLLKLLDFDFLGFLIDEDESINCEISERYSVKYVEEILYEEDYYIWVYDAKRAVRLHELGLIYLKQYLCYGYIIDITINRKNLLDVNLAYNYLSDSEYPGFEVYGKETEDAYKIAILGGSTTDGRLYPFKSWPEILHEKLGRDNITIYNGGVYGYMSGQELIKLIRDVLRLKPDMIIVYDGVNDEVANDKYPLMHSYAEQVYRYAGAHISDSLTWINDTEDICRGIASLGSRFDNWLSNIQTMHAIANDRNIRFFNICQPNLWSKRGTTTQEKNMILSIASRHVSNLIEGAFRKSIEQLQELPDYIYDLSHILDGQSDVYIDLGHLCEKGNDIVAEEVKKIILPALRESI